MCDRQNFSDTPVDPEMSREAADMASMLVQHAYDPTLIMALPDRYGHWGPLSEVKAFNDAVNQDLIDKGIPYEQLHVDIGLNNNACRPGQYVNFWATLHREGFQDSSTSVGRHYVDLPYCF
jgi:hypothetical protein